MELSENGLEILKELETGDGEAKLEAYPDGDGFAIGYGHHSSGPGDFEVTETTTITPEQAEELLMNDVSVFSEQVNKLFGKLNLSQNEFDALVIAFYNRPEAVKNSGLVNAIVAGDEDAIEDAWYNSIPEGSPRGIRSKRVPTELDLFFNESESVDTPESTPSIEEPVSTQDDELRRVMSQHMLDVIRAKTGNNVRAE